MLNSKNKIYLFTNIHTKIHFIRKYWLLEPVKNNFELNFLFYNQSLKFYLLIYPISGKFYFNYPKF